MAGLREAFIRRLIVDPAFWFTGRLIAALLNPDGRKEAFTRSLEAELLLLDDLGGGGHFKARGFAVNQIEELLMLREAEDLPTMITTNLPPDSFRELIGDRVLDRIRGDWGRWCNVTNASLRTKAKAE